MRNDTWGVTKHPYLIAVHVMETSFLSFKISMPTCEDNGLIFFNGNGVVFAEVEGQTQQLSYFISF